MATRRICDRCGKAIEYVGWTAKLRNVFKKGKRIKIYEFLDGNRSGYDYHESCYELCAGCTSQLEEFLKEK